MVKKVVKVKQGLVKKVLKTLDSYMAIDPRKGLKPQGLQWQKRWFNHRFSKKSRILSGRVIPTRFLCLKNWLPFKNFLALLDVIWGHLGIEQIMFQSVFHSLFQSWLGLGSDFGFPYKMHWNILWDIHFYYLMAPK